MVDIGFKSSITVSVGRVNEGKTNALKLHISQNNCEKYIIGRQNHENLNFIILF